MAKVLSRLDIILFANTAQYRSEMRETGESTRTLMQAMGDDAKKMAKVGAAAFASMAAVGATAIGVMIKEQVALGNEIANAASAANTSVKEIQRLGAAAKAVGLDYEGLSGALQDTQEAVGDFLSTGGGPMADFFDNVAPQIGVTAEQFRNLSGPDALQLYYDSLQKANLSQSEMIFYMKSVSEEGAILMPMLHDMGAGFDVWAAAAENAGAIMDEETIRATQELQAANELLTLSYEGAKNQITQGMMPVLSDLAGLLVEDASAADTAREAGEYLAKGFKVISATGIGVITIVKGIGKAIWALGESFAQWGHVMDGVDTSSPFAFFQLAKNVAFDVPVAQFKALGNSFSEIKTDFAEADTLMGKLMHLGEGGTNKTVSAVVKLNQKQSEFNKTLGKTGQQYQSQQKAAEEAAKAAEKTAKAAEKTAKASTKELTEQIKVYNAWKHAGLSDNQARIITAEVGRENDYQKKYLYGGHSDPANGKYNLGMLSWQKERGKELFDYLKNLGLIRNNKIVESQEALNAQAMFAVKEMSTNSDYKRTKTQFLGNADIGYKDGVEVLGNNFIRWRYTDPKYANHHGRRDRYYDKLNNDLGAGGGADYVKQAQMEANAAEQQAKEAARIAEQQAKQRETIRREYADKITQIEIDLATKLKTIEDSNFGADEKQQLIAKATEHADIEIKQYQRTQAEKIAALTKFGKTESDLIKQDADQRIAALKLEQELTDEQKLLGIANIEAERDYKLNQLAVTHDLEMQHSRSYAQTESERIKNQYELERRQIELTVGMDEDLRTAKIESLNYAEKQALEELRIAYQDELNQLNSFGMTELERIRAQYAQQRAQLQRRTDINPEQKSLLGDSITANQIYATDQYKDQMRGQWGAIKSESNGTNANYQLAEQYKSRLDIIRDALAAEVITVKEAEQAKLDARIQFESAATQLTLSSAENMAGNLAASFKTMLGEQNLAYKIMFGAQQTFVMASAGLNMWDAYGDVMAEGATLSQKLTGAATIAAEFGRIIQAASSVKLELPGFQVGGFTGRGRVDEIAGFAHKEEFIANAPTTRKYRPELEAMHNGTYERNTGETNINVNVNVESNGQSSVEANHEFGKQLGNGLTEKIKQVMVQEKRPGGLLYA